MEGIDSMHSPACNAYSPPIITKPLPAKSQPSSKRTETRKHSLFSMKKRISRGLERTRLVTKISKTSQERPPHLHKAMPKTSASPTTKVAFEATTFSAD
mmetsp:Transcript_9067/g.20274  ORF Transcript_9067/g.20274 Transcript_9067/m.20274 type:complete len:99 (-) Transcript_9067:1240-1536(-)|eukprot:scaffold3146_cov186-Alexandrium_tamarense.AAC.7